MLFPPQGTERLGYKRCSNAGKGLDGGSHLLPWQIHTAFTGIIAKPELHARLKAMVAADHKWDTHPGEWKNIIKKAQVAGGSESKADRGTAIHDLCEAAEIGWLDWDLVDESLVPLMEDYDRLLSEFTFLDRELFVAADITIEVPGREPWTLRSAGSVDRVCEWNGKRYIVDIKSGRDDEFRTGVTGQTFLYQRAKLYRDDIVKQDAPWANDYWIPGIGNPSERVDMQTESDHSLMFHAGADHVWRVFAVPLGKGEEIVTVGEWAGKANYVKKFERVL